MKDKPRPITDEHDLNRLGSLISWSVNGSEHGVITYDQWRVKCGELVDFCNYYNIPVHGEWTIKYEPPQTV